MRNRNQNNNINRRGKSTSTRNKKISSALMLIIIVLFVMSTLPGLDFLIDIAIFLFVPFALFSGKESSNASISYGYLSLALFVLLFLMLERLF